MEALADERGKLRRALVEGHAALRRKLSAALSVPLEAMPRRWLPRSARTGAGDEAGLRLAAAALCAGSDTDRERGAVIAGWCAAPNRRVGMLAAYKRAYLTNDGQVRRPLITKPAARSAACDAKAILAAEARAVAKAARSAGGGRAA